MKYTHLYLYDFEFLEQYFDAQRIRNTFDFYDLQKKIFRLLVYLSRILKKDFSHYKHTF